MYQMLNLPAPFKVASCRYQSDAPVEAYFAHAKEALKKVPCVSMFDLLCSEAKN